MRVLRVSLLGHFEARTGGEVIQGFESAKARALLAFLAAESDRPHSREALAGMLWPDHSDSAALSNLRHTLASLRSTLGEGTQGRDAALPPLFVIAPNTIQLGPLGRVQVDVHEFEQHLAAASPQRELLPEPRIAHLRAAVELCRGRFMEGFSLRSCPEFEDWLLLRRENAALKLQSALRALAEAQESTGALEEALETVRRLLELEPWDEAAHRRMMALLTVLGQRGAALAQYRRCCQLLRDEVGVEPEPETVRLFEQISAGDYATLASVQLSSKPPSTKRLAEPAAQPNRQPGSHFVGREIELARLWESLRLALREQGQLLFITGEAGSGKTSLAWEFAHQAMAQHSDLLVAAGRSNTVTGLEDPYLPFREIVAMLMGGKGAQAGQTLTPEHQRRLAEAFPDAIRALLTAGPELIGSFIRREILTQRIEAFGPGRHAWQREAMLLLEQVSDPTLLRAPVSGVPQKPGESLVRALGELASRHPLILLIDDLHWADLESIGVLHYLGRRLTGRRILVLGAYRPQDVALGRRTAGSSWERHPLEPVRWELQRELGEIEINLDRVQGLAFVNALIDSEPNCLDETFRETLHGHTEGNPLFTVELLRSMQERGDLARDGSGRCAARAEISWNRLPARVEAVIAERIGRLPPVQQALLRAASVEGETFSAEVAARVVGLPERDALGWLSGPLSRDQRLVAAVSPARINPSMAGQVAQSHQYRFGHFLFRAYLYSRLDGIERATFHESTGRVLEDMYGPYADDIALGLAWHYEEGGAPLHAAKHLLVAGKRAASLYAYTQAKALYDRCLALIQQVPPSPERIRLEIEVQLASAAPLFGFEGFGGPEATRAANRAIELLEQLGPDSPDSARLLALYFVTSYLTAVNRLVEALAHTELLLKQAAALGERVYTVLAYEKAGQVHLFSGQPLTAAGYLEEAIERYRPEDEDFLAGVTGYSVLHACLIWDAWAQWLLGHLSRSEALRQQAIEKARSLSPLFRGPLALVGAQLSAVQNDIDPAATYAEECLGLPDTGGNRIIRAVGEVIMGWVQVRRGDFAAGLSLLRLGIEDWQQTGARTMLPANSVLLADALSLAGQTDQALAVLASLESAFEETGRRMLEAHLHWLRGEIILRERYRSGSTWRPDLSPRQSFERGIAVAQQQQARSLELRATTSLARLLSERGSPGEAIARLESVLQHFGDGATASDLRDARELLATLATSEAT